MESKEVIKEAIVFFNKVKDLYMVQDSFVQAVLASIVTGIVVAILIWFVKAVFSSKPSEIKSFR